ncbi:MAG: hypothetical protein A4S14_15455 [Proteobacteria bacterium SG_bin9]|nr:MAG: hypothetical protein A4S14_15455 [Proteobacteria bacterium SG_bin9]
MTMQGIRAALVALALMPCAAHAGIEDTVRARFTESCAVTAQDSEQQAYTACRTALFSDASFHRLFAPVLRWGGDAAGKSISELSLTQFDPRIFAGLYLPLFKTTGRLIAEFDEVEKRTVLKLQVRFRNQLDIGQYPYPFWHSPAKWSAYEAANQLLFYVNDSGLIDVVLRSPQGTEKGLPAVKPVAPPAFDGKWSWSNGEDQPQPATSWFGGLLRAENPHLDRVVETYRQFANSLRASDCTTCHVPSNPAFSKRLVLLQTPAHAAGEIRRVLAAVRDSKMPVDDLGEPRHLSDALKSVLLREGQSFSDTIDAALAWERQRDSHH